MFTPDASFVRIPEPAARAIVRWPGGRYVSPAYGTWGDAMRMAIRMAARLSEATPEQVRDFAERERAQSGEPFTAAALRDQHLANHRALLALADMLESDPRAEGEAGNAIQFPTPNKETAA